MGQRKSFKRFVTRDKKKQTIYHWHRHLLSTALCIAAKQTCAEQQFDCGIRWLDVVTHNLSQPTHVLFFFCSAVFIVRRTGNAHVCFSEDDPALIGVYTLPHAHFAARHSALMCDIILTLLQLSEWSQIAQGESVLVWRVTVTGATIKPRPSHSFLNFSVWSRVSGLLIWSR